MLPCRVIVRAHPRPNFNASPFTLLAPSEREGSLEGPSPALPSSPYLQCPNVPTFKRSNDSVHPLIPILERIPPPHTSLYFQSHVGTPFCNPFVSMVFNGMGGCTPLSSFEPRLSPGSAFCPFLVFKKLQIANFTTPFFCYSCKLVGGVPPPFRSKLRSHRGAESPTGSERSDVFGRHIDGIVRGDYDAGKSSKEVGSRETSDGKKVRPCGNSWSSGWPWES